MIIHFLSSDYSVALLCLDQRNSNALPLRYAILFNHAIMLGPGKSTTEELGPGKSITEDMGQGNSVIKEQNFRLSSSVGHFQSH
jgi:hypothetical protein